MHIQEFMNKLVEDGVFTKEEIRSGPNAVAYGGDMLLHCAVYFRDIELISELLKLGADVNAPGVTASAPLAG